LLFRRRGLIRGPMLVIVIIVSAICVTWYYAGVIDREEDSRS